MVQAHTTGQADVASRPALSGVYGVWCSWELGRLEREATVSTEQAKQAWEVSQPRVLTRQDCLSLA